MNDTIKAVWLGIFILVALLMTIWLVLFVKPTFGDGDVKLKVRFANLDKITRGSQVTFAGKPVGEVEQISEIPNFRNSTVDSKGNLYIYELILKVDSSVNVFTYDEIMVTTSGLMGEKSIAIIPKATPRNAPAPKNITEEILYACSAETLEQTLTKLSVVADTFKDTLNEVNSLVQNNHETFHTALQSLTTASQELHDFVDHMSKSNFVGRFTDASEAIVNSMGEVEGFFATAQGEGTFGKLLNSDSLYDQVNTVLCQLRIVLADIRNYGLLYQFDRKWQRMHDAGKRSQH